ncbi:hypothetical protein evm_013726 [Chilo suppressalis]|nr:hypothetical protein evm_013726 [Chilo suppressalis]
MLGARREHIELEWRSRACLLPWERHLQHFGAYHSSVCAKECFARRVWTACGCLPAFLPHLPPGRVCTLPAVPCFLRLKKQNHPTSAECECPRNCESRRYSADMTVGNLRAISHALDDIYKNHTLNMSSALMHFYFPTSVYVKQKQETVMSINTLISNLGGVFGLCVGCSAISVVELVFFLYSALRGRNRVRYSN